MQDKMGVEVVCIGDMQNAYKISISISEGKKPTFMTHADGIILRSILKKQGVRARIGFI
jgi:hypothetical protein